MTEYVCFVGDGEFRKGIHRHPINAPSIEKAARAARAVCSYHDAAVVEVFVHDGHRFVTDLVRQAND